MTTIAIKKTLFQNALSAMLVAAGDDAERPHIACVQFWQRGDKFGMAGTDGHWAAQFEEVVGTDDDVDRFGIARHDAEFLAGVLKLDKTDEEDAEIEVQIGNGLTIECDRWTVKLPAVPLDLPDIEVLVKGTERGQLPCITLDPRILADVRKAFKVCGGIGNGDEALDFGFGPSLLHPVLITSEKVPALACIVMPRKPGDVDVKEDGETRRYVRRDTGEVLHSEPVSKQTCIAGTESDPVKESLDALQAAADAVGEELRVHTAEGTTTVKPRKRGKKAELN